MAHMQDLANYAQARPNTAVAGALLTRGEADCSYVRCDENSRFEIGSITKLFTALLLAEASLDCRCSLDDPVDKFLPQGRAAPNYRGMTISLRHLATHSSGLPRLPLEMMRREAHSTQPYERWDRVRLLAAYSQSNLTDPPGSVYRYSNFGFAILGAALEQILDGPFESLLAAVTRRLECPGIHLPSSEERALLAVGRRVEPWNFAAFAPAGGATATLSDMARFARHITLNPPPAVLLIQQAQSTYPVSTSFDGHLRRGLTALVSRIKPGRSKRTQTMGLGWHLSGDLQWHNGGTAGFRSFLGIQPAQAVAVVLAAHTDSVDQVGLSLLRRLPASVV
jgi:serine-type D-Ala-D-Ala carboxypeptidase/endopeptidase